MKGGFGLLRCALVAAVAVGVGLGGAPADRAASLGFSLGPIAVPVTITSSQQVSATGASCDRIAFSDSYYFYAPGDGTLDIIEKGSGHESKGPIGDDGTFSTKPVGPTGQVAYVGKINGETATATATVQATGCTYVYELSYNVVPVASSDLSVDWEMPTRLTPALEQMWGKEEPYGLPPASFVDPPEWKVILFLRSRGGEDPCASGFSYRWQVIGAGVSKVLPDTGCRVETSVPSLGVYDVVTTQLRGGVASGAVGENKQVLVRDWLIVGLGDSNGSGEGNPPWVFPECDRGLTSSQYWTARDVQSSHSSVTFIFASCSGARTDHLWEHSYAGIQPKLGRPLPPQVEQVRRVLGNRKVDAVIMSVGINDLYFGALMTFCVKDEAEIPGIRPGVVCESEHVKAEYDSEGFVSSYTKDSRSRQTLMSLTTRQVDLLRVRYALLAQHLVALNPAHVFITQYPDNAHDQNGNLCTEVSGGHFPNFYASTWAWLSRTGDALNRRVSAASKLGWTAITGIPEDFLTHGYCSTESYFVSIRNAVLMANTDGSFHPSANGQYVNETHTRKAVCLALYGDSDCNDG